MYPNQTAASAKVWGGRDASGFGRAWSELRQPRFSSEEREGSKVHHAESNHRTLGIAYLGLRAGVQGDEDQTASLAMLGGSAGPSGHGEFDRLRCFRASEEVGESFPPRKGKGAASRRHELQSSGWRECAGKGRVPEIVFGLCSGRSWTAASQAGLRFCLDSDRSDGMWSLLCVQDCGSREERQVCQAISPGSIGLSRVSNGTGEQRTFCRINTLRSSEGGRTVWQHAARHWSNGVRGRSVSEAQSACRGCVIADRLAGRETLRGVHRRSGGKPGTEGFGSPNLVQTRRTLWSAAGCNKPAGRCAE
jgi:hypothetical protein